MDQSSVSINARQWSASVLEVDPNCQTTDLLRRLTDDDYVVSSDWADAMQILVNPQASSLPANAINLATEAGTRERLEVAVTGFAKSFFEIPPQRRRAQWQALRNDCQSFPQLTRWLDNLELALSIPRIQSHGDDTIDTFVDLCCQSFVARGAERARRRQAVADMFCQNPAVWQPVVKHLHVHQSDFVTVVAPWILKLQAIYFAVSTKDNPLPVPEVATVTPPAKSEGQWWGWFVALSIVSAIIRGIASNHSSSSNNNSPLNSNRPIINRRIEPEVERELIKLFGDKKEPENTDRESLRLGVKAMNEYMRRKYGSGAKEMNEPAEVVDEPPADALMPDQAPSNE